MNYKLCPQCCSYMGLVKDNTWYKCPTCAYMEKVNKKIIKPVGRKK